MTQDHFLSLFDFSFINTVILMGGNMLDGQTGAQTSLPGKNALPLG
jgi:hypothetical protein